VAQLDPVTVGAVEPDSAAQRAGLRPGDVIVEADGRPISRYDQLEEYLLDPRAWKGKNDLKLTVRREGAAQAAALPPVWPRTIGLQPTQVYESVSMFFLFLLLTSYFPFRKHDGEVTAILMFGYGLHRTLNELLRSDDRPTGFEMYVSVFLIVAGAALFLWLRSRPAQHPGMARAAAAARPQVVG
jgi:phosphatidylglycerol:prolipoprotein diacylglycerol transferase